MSEEKITLRDVVIVEIQELMKTSKELQQNIKEAKTAVKSEYFRKKIKKNNERLMEMLVALEKLDKNKEENDDSSPDTEEEQTDSV